MLLACVGSQDPENKKRQDGPILTVLSEHAFSRVDVFATRGFRERARRLGERVRERFPKTKFTIVSLDAKRPHDLRCVLPALGRAVAEIQAAWPGGGVPVFVCPQPGTPAMAASWYLLVTERNLAAKLVFSVDPTHRKDGEPKTYEADYTEIFARMGWPRAKQVLEERLDALQKERWPDPVGESKRIRAAMKLASKYARSREPLLIHGPSGTGKELFAYRVHAHSMVSSGPFVPVNASQLDPNLARAELFGYLKGAFTGAQRDHKGFVAQAQGGTLFLDEFGDLPGSVQPMLLRLMEQQECPVMGGDTIRVSVRFLAATNRPLASLRGDLVQRFPFHIELPPLQEHSEDIPLLIEEFLHRPSLVADAGTRRFAQDLVDWCTRRPWSEGNVRELGGFVHRVVMRCEDAVITLARVQEEAPDLLVLESEGEADPAGLRGNALKQAYHSGGVLRIQPVLERALRSTGSRSAAARDLDINRKTLQRYLEECEREGIPVLSRVRKA